MTRLLGCRPSAALPPALPGFAQINRYWDAHAGCVAAKILPGEYYVSSRDEMIATVLGSCVSACIRDTRVGVGGMNHFMLPDGGAGRLDDAARYGVYAMELLINAVLKHGGDRRFLEVKLVGGGRMIANMSDVGRRNIEFVQRFLATEALAVAAADLGDVYPRKVCYYPMTGRMRVKRLRSLHGDTVVRREADYLQDLRRQPPAGDVELF